MPLFNDAKGAIAGLDTLGAGSIDLDDDTFYVMLLDNTLEPDIDADTVRDDISANEVGNSGTYTAGGSAIAGAAVTVVDGSDWAAWGVGATANSWTSATITARYAVIYKSTGNSATDNLVAYIDFGEDKTSTAGTFQITWNAAGIITLA